MPIFSVLSGVTNNLISDELFYNKTIALPLPSARFSQASLPELLKCGSPTLLLTYHQKVRKTLDELQILERDTMSQSTSVWHQEREIRMTASDVHDILHAKDLNSVRDRLLSHIAPSQSGKRLEPMVKNMLRTDYKSYIFRSTGLVVHPDIQFLCASPDGLLFKSDDIMLVKVKCTCNPKHLSLLQLFQQRQDFCLDFDSSLECFKLKPTHKYFTEIQMLMFCSGVDKCLFVMFFDYGKPVFKELIEKDHSFWNSDKLNALSQFYFSSYLPKYLAAQGKI